MTYKFFRQANVSTVYRRPVSEKLDDINTKEILSSNNKQGQLKLDEISTAGPSNANKIDKAISDPIKLLREENQNKKSQQVEEKADENASTLNQTPLSANNSKTTPSNLSLSSQESLERRLNIEEEVTFVSNQLSQCF